MTCIDGFDEFKESSGRGDAALHKRFELRRQGCIVRLTQRHIEMMIQSFSLGFDHTRQILQPKLIEVRDRVSSGQSGTESSRLTDLLGQQRQPIDHQLHQVIAVEVRVENQVGLISRLAHQRQQIGD